MKLKDLIKKYESKTSDENRYKKWGWFSLKNDGDDALVRFLIGNEDEMLEFTHEIHKVMVGEREQKFKCLGDECEFCKRGEKPQLRIWVPLYNYSKGELQLWERGVSDIKELLNQIEEVGNLTERDFKIKRKGGKGDNRTTYTYIAKDKKFLDKLDEYRSQLPQIVGKYYVINATPDMQREVISNNSKVKTQDVGEEVF